MPRLIRRHHKYFIVAFSALFFLGGRPAEFGQEASFFHGFPISKPVIRIALGVNLEDIHVHASSGMKLYLANQSYKLLADGVSEIRVRGHREALTEKYLILVFQTRRRNEAEKTARELRAKIPRRVYVAEDLGEDLEGVFQVRVGDFLTRGDALSFIKRLTALGIPEAWIIREEVSLPSSSPRWVLVNDELLDLEERTALYIIPSSVQSYLAFGGRNYRGIFVLKGSRRGVVLINVVNLEDYLKGVVPGELSPVHFGEIEALKAQAVAARTYALKNLGQFEDLGFDLYDTPASQVYQGMAVEHPLSSQAVEDTRGQVAVYDGRLINALYTSTCGGATENADAVFGGPPVPYLKSTECIWENERVFGLNAGAAAPAVYIGPKNVAVEMAELAGLGVLAIPSDPSWYSLPAAADEAASWVRRAAGISGRKREGLEMSPGAPTPLSLGRLLVDAFEWGERVSVLLGQHEAEYATRDWPELDPRDRPLAAFLRTSGIVDPDEKDIRGRPLSRAEAALLVRRAIVLSRDPYRRGTFDRLGKKDISFVSNGERETLPMAASMILVRRFGDETAPAGAIELAGGEAVRWIEADGELRLLEVQAEPLTNILDQPSQYHRWEVRVAREELDGRLNQFYPIGRLVDLAAVSRGESKRLLDLLVIGQEGQVHVTGLKIRQVLSVRDTLFVIDRELDAEGRVLHFVFSGKGWGHGVGLCQVGAFRMAQKGATYDEILKKYYRGIKLKRMD
jgi:stage II sporulation protein D